MSNAVTRPTPQLSYETEFKEERLPDGTLRLTVVHQRSHALKWFGLMVIAAVVAGGSLVGLWMLTGSLKAIVYALAFMPLVLVFGGLMMLLQLRGPRLQTHVVEVGPAGLLIQTALMGSPVTHRHARSEVIAVRCNGMALEVHTTRRGDYSCMAFVKQKHLKAIAEILNRELSLAS